MKKSIALLPVFALLLGACSSTAPQENSTTATVSETVAVSDQVLDDEIFKRAATLMDQDQCGSILSGETRENCKKVVSALQSTKNASSELSQGMCLDIELERYRENCSNEVDQAIKKANAVKEMEKHSEENQKIATSASEKKDVSLCDKIETQSQKFSCRYNVLANQALEENDNKPCADIGDSAFEEMCLSNLE